MNEAAVYLVPIGSGGFELYTEPADDSASGAVPGEHDGFVHRALHRLQERWRQTADAAARGPNTGAGAPGRVARARGWLVRRIAESIAEQRTLWSLRNVTAAVLTYPADLSGGVAGAIRERLLGDARRHHGWWLLANSAAVALTAVLALLPGPNIVGYYFLFRLVGHYLSWRGARQGLERIEWRGVADPILTELGALTHLARDERADRVAALATALRLPRLAAFFDRVAVAAR